jgi:hypothetical protein
MATPQASIHAFQPQDRARLTITSEEISRYAAVTSQISKLQKEEASLRVELLGLYSVGAEQETGSPYLLNFVEQQECRTVDWNTEAWKLAEKLYGFEKASRWITKAEESASVTPKTIEIRIEPNPSFAAGLANLAGSMWFDASSSAADERFGGRP